MDTRQESPSGLCSIPEAAKRLGIGEATAYDLRRAGTFPVEVIKLGGKFRVRVAELEAFLRGSAVPA